LIWVIKEPNIVTEINTGLANIFIEKLQNKPVNTIPPVI
jgi:hypothetical protein